MSGRHCASGGYSRRSLAVELEGCRLRKHVGLTGRRGMTFSGGAGAIFVLALLMGSVQVTPAPELPGARRRWPPRPPVGTLFNTVFHSETLTEPAASARRMSINETIIAV